MGQVECFGKEFLEFQIAVLQMLYVEAREKRKKIYIYTVYFFLTYYGNLSDITLCLQI